MNFLTIFALVVATLLIGDKAVASSPRVELTRHLLHGYDKTVHPDNVQLEYGLIYLDCPIPDPITGALVSRLHETQRWPDDRLSWEPRDHHQLQSVVVSPDDVWTPGVSVDSNVGYAHEQSATEVRLSVSYPGVLLRSRILEISSDCELVAGAWKCQLRFVAWNNAGENFGMESSEGDSSIRVCPSNIKIEEYSAHVEQMEGSCSMFEYVISMVIGYQ